MSTPKLTLTLGIAILALFFTTAGAEATVAIAEPLDANAGVLEILDFSLTPSAFSPDGDGVDDVVKIKATLSEVASYNVCVIPPSGECSSIASGEAAVIETKWDGYSPVIDPETGLVGSFEKIPGIFTIWIEVLDERNERVGLSAKVELLETAVPLSPTPTLTPAPITPPPIRTTPPYTVEPQPLEVPPEVIEECIRELSKEPEMTPEEVEKICYGMKVTRAVPPDTLPLPPPMPSIEECIQELSKEPEMTLEGAKRMCTMMISPNIEDRMMRECYGMLMLEPGMTIGDVDRLCTAMSIEPRGYCDALEDKLIVLVRELKGASTSEQESLQEDIESIKMEMLPCELRTRAIPVIAVEVPVMDPCAEAHELRMILADMEKHRVDLKESAVKGEIEEEELDDFDREMEYLRSRLEKTSWMCNQGGKAEVEVEEAVAEVEESPCSKLASLTSIYREIKELEASEEGEASEEFEAKLYALAQEISVLKDKCRRADLTMEEVESFGDVEKIYATKLKASVEGASNEELLEELKAIEEEKRRLIEDFASKIQELELKETRIIKKMRIEGGEVSLDDVKVSIPKIKIEVEGVEVEIIPGKGEVKIVEGNVTVKGNIKLEYSNKILMAVESGRPIKVLPSELISIVKGEIEEVEMVDEEAPRYKIKSREKGKFLWVVPVTVAKESQVNAESGRLISEDRPWWSFLVFH